MATGRISAGNNLTIDMDADRWRLLINGDSAERVLVEASSGEPLRYLPTFGQRRRLPDTGVLPTLYIQRVVLGWSVKDEAWHLGLLLESELADARGSRWCEVAHWPDPERDLYLDVATQAGNGLAQVVTRPFDVIPPRTADAVSASSVSVPAPLGTPYTPSAPAAPAYRPPVPLPALPITVDDWQVEQASADTLELRRSGAWARGKRLRAVWYMLLVVVYLVLSITTLQGYIALPKPEFLPYLGLISAAILFIMAIALLVRVSRTPNRFRISAEQGVVALRGNSERWRVPTGEIESVYASQVVGRKIRREQRTIHYGELSLLLKDGAFKCLLENDQVEEKPILVDENTPAVEGVTPLHSQDVSGTMQAVAAHVAQVLNLPTMYDQRLK